MKRLAFVAIAVAMVAASTAAREAHAIRIAYYRIGAGASIPSSPGEPRYGLGPTAGIGVLLPFRPFFGATLDAGYDRVPWTAAVTTVPEITWKRDPFQVISALAGVEFLPARGRNVRPVFSAAVGIVRLMQGDTHVTDMNAGPSTVRGESRTSVAFSAGVGLRFRRFGHSAVRVQTQILGFGHDSSDDLAYLIPLKVQFEF